MGGGDPALWQLSGLVAQTGDVLALTVDAKATAGAAGLRMTLYVEAFGMRLPVATQAVTLTDPMAPYVLAVEDTSAFVGLAVGIELAGVGGPETSLALDNVRLNPVQ